MSQWTHVNGSIRFDCFGIGRPMVEPDMLKNPPCGSEGPLTVENVVVYRRPHQAFITTSISGDLRDFGEEDVVDIIKWLTEHTDDFKDVGIIRSGIVEIAVEYGNTYIYQYNDVSGIWECIVTQAHKEEE